MFNLDEVASGTSDGNMDGIAENNEEHQDQPEVRRPTRAKAVSERLGARPGAITEDSWDDEIIIIIQRIFIQDVHFNKLKTAVITVCTVP